MVVSSPPSITLNMMRAATPRSLPQLHLGVLPHLLQEFQVRPHAEQVITRDPVPVGTFLKFLLNLDILLFAYRVESYAVAYVRELNRFLEGGVPLLWLIHLHRCSSYHLISSGTPQRIDDFVRRPHPQRSLGGPGSRGVVFGGSDCVSRIQRKRVGISRQPSQIRHRITRGLLAPAPLVWVPQPNDAADDAAV